MTRINLNDWIKVKLTDHGKDIFYHRYDALNSYRGRVICKPRYPTQDADGYTEFQLWEFMELYGNYIGLAKENVIMPIEIIYEGGDRGE